MGAYNSFYRKFICPKCGETGKQEYQTKDSLVWARTKSGRKYSLNFADFLKLNLSDIENGTAIVMCYKCHYFEEVKIKQGKIKVLKKNG